MGQTKDDDLAAVDALDDAIRLLGGSKDEERILGATISLGHTDALRKTPEARERLLGAVDAEFINRLLGSAAALQRVGLALLQVLLADVEAASRLRDCIGPLAESCARLLAEAKPEANAQADSEGGADEPWGLPELMQAVEVLRQAARYLEDVRPACERLLQLVSPGGPVAEAVLDDADAAFSALSLAQEAGVAATALVLAACLAKPLRGSSAHILALALLAVEAEAAPVERLDEALSEAIAAGAAARRPALRLAAATMSRSGLSFGRGGGPLLARLKPLLSWMAGELRLGLEGYATDDDTCAACAALEATIVAFGREAAQLETAGCLEDVSDCLRQLHRAMSDVHCFCADILHSNDVPVVLPMLARVAAAWQLEDPRQYGSEFLRSLPVFCRLPCVEFAVLLPCIHELPEWHLTPAFPKVFEVCLASLQDQSAFPHVGDVFRQCALMLTEVALDAAAYLPEASVPRPVWEGAAPGAAASSSAAAPGAASLPRELPRPLQAADAAHEGVRRLCRWSCALWSAGASACRGSTMYWELGLLCGALLVSVPQETVAQCPGASAVTGAAWVAAVEALFAGADVDATAQRLAVRLAGFALDRHAPLALALRRAVCAQPRAKLPSWRPAATQSSDADDEDEWAAADAAAQAVVEEFMAAVAGRASEAPDSAPVEAYPTEALDSMD